MIGQDIDSFLQLGSNHLWRSMEAAAGLIYSGNRQLR